MTQVIINILLTASVYVIIATGFALIYETTKSFNISHALFINMGPYLVYSATNNGINLLVSVLISVVVCGMLSIPLETYLFRKLREKAVPTLMIFIISLGLYIIVQNIISLVYGDATVSIRFWDIKKGFELAGGYITSVQLIIICSSLAITIGALLILSNSATGNRIRAVSDNPSLSSVFGINSNKVITSAFIFSSILASLAGILIALDIDLRPTMGFSFFLSGVIVLIIGGLGSFKGIVYASFLLAGSQHCVGYFIDSKWMNAMAYILLIAFLYFRPYGFSGQSLKKSEV